MFGHCYGWGCLARWLLHLCLHLYLGLYLYLHLHLHLHLTKGVTIRPELRQKLPTLLLLETMGRGTPIIEAVVLGIDLQIHRVQCAALAMVVSVHLSRVLARALLNSAEECRHCFGCTDVKYCINGHCVREA